MSIRVQHGTVCLYGDVGDFGEAEHFTPSDVVDALSQVGRSNPVLVSMNSGGGDAMSGLTIYNLLEGHQGRVTVEVDGIAASAASLIAMAGRSVVMKAGSLMMVHDPRAVTIGNLAEHNKSAEILDKLSEQYAMVYAKKTGKSVSAVRRLMEQEVWLTASEAVKEGFADYAEPMPARMAATFDYGKYAHAPAKLTQQPLSMEDNMRKLCGLQPVAQSKTTGSFDMVANMRKQLGIEEDKDTAATASQSTTAKGSFDLVANMRKQLAKRAG